MFPTFSLPQICSYYNFETGRKLIKSRDDLTVEVIFFGDGEKSGDVVLNKEASASATADVKAKL
jgi:hypothetical protein